MKHTWTHMDGSWTLFIYMLLVHENVKPVNNTPKTAERKYQHINNPANCMMKRTSSSAPVCLLVIVYVCYLLNNTKNPIIKRSVS